MTLPLGIRVLTLLRERMPDCQWDPRLVAQCVVDFEQDVDVLEVAARCAAFMQEKPGAMNGPRTLRTFLERERRSAAAGTELERRRKALTVYDRPRNQGR